MTSIHKEKQVANFTKTEMLDELQEIIYEYARSISFGLAPAIGYQVLFGGERKDVDVDVHNFMSPDNNSKTIGRSFSIKDFEVTRIVEQYYDYGVMGLRDFSLDYVIGATEWTFAYGLIYDMSESFLHYESCNGVTVHTDKCMYAAKAFFARLVLDGGERVYLPGVYLPDDVLTLGEMAILSGLDERTIRNATSKNATNRLETTLIDSNIFIPRDAAISWLQSKRAFVPTKIGKERFEVVLTSSFTSLIEAGDFVEKVRDSMSINIEELASRLNGLMSKEDIISIESGNSYANENSLIALGHAIGLDGQLFALRILEATQKKELIELQRRINGFSLVNNKDKHD